MESGRRNFLKFLGLGGLGIVLGLREKIEKGTWGEVKELAEEKKFLLEPPKTLVETPSIDLFAEEEKPITFGYLQMYGTSYTCTSSVITPNYNYYPHNATVSFYSPQTIVFSNSNYVTFGTVNNANITITASNW